jgi:hypothetical protein
MAKRLTLHLQQNTTLPRIRTILDFYDRQIEALGEDCLSLDNLDLENLAMECGLSLSVLKKNVFPFLRNLKILESGYKFKLTDIGIQLINIENINPDLLGDFLHLLLYRQYIIDSQQRYSWAYRNVIQRLWQRQEVVLSTEAKKYLIGEIVEAAAQEFSLPVQNIAFSESSISGILNWLRYLNPSVIGVEQKMEKFQCRNFCAAPVTIAAINCLYQAFNRPYGTKIFIREEVKNQLSQMLIINPNSLDNTLENAKRTYDYDRGGIFDFGYEGGYGQWLTLLQHSEWEDLL